MIIVVLLYLQKNIVYLRHVVRHDLLKLFSASSCALSSNSSPKVTVSAPVANSETLLRLRMFSLRFQWNGLEQRF